jgi:hypothetical protein
MNPKRRRGILNYLPGRRRGRHEEEGAAQQQRRGGPVRQDHACPTLDPATPARDPATPAAILDVASPQRRCPAATSSPPASPVCSPLNCAGELSGTSKITSHASKNSKIVGYADNTSQLTI